LDVHTYNFVCLQSCAPTATVSESNNPTDATTYSLSIKELAGIFIIHVTLSVLSLFVALPTWYRSRKRRGKQANDTAHPGDSEDSIPESEHSLSALNPPGVTDCESNFLVDGSGCLESESDSLVDA
jgi:hypothetical protein